MPADGPCLAGSDASGGRGTGAWAFAGLAALAVVLAFPGPATGISTLFVRDFGVCHYPMAAFQRSCLAAGEIPHWNPLTQHGLPFLAEWDTLAIYPPAALWVVLPMPWSVNLFVLLHVWVAALGARALAHAWTGSRLAADLGGVAFAFGGLCLNATMWTNGIAALAWMPWIVLGVERIARGAGPRAIAWTALASAMQLLTGAPETIVATWLVAVVAVLAEPPSGARARGRFALDVAAAVAIATLLAAPQLLPFFELIHLSQRAPGWTTSHWSLPIWGWANLLVPAFRTQHFSGMLIQAEQNWTLSYYTGAGVLVLAAAAPWVARSRRVVVLGVLVVVCLWLALGDRGGLYLALRRLVPALTVARYPAKFMFPCALVVPMLAAASFARVLDGEGARAAARKVAIAGAVAIAAIGAIGAIHAMFPLAYEDHAVVWTSVVSRALVVVATIAVVVAASRGGARAWIPAVAAIALVWIDGRTHLPVTPTASPAIFDPGVLRGELDPPPELGRGRALVDRAVERQLNLSTLPDPAANFVAIRLAASWNTPMIEGLSALDGFFPLDLPWERTYRGLLEQLKDDPAREPLLDFDGVTHVLPTVDGFPWKRRATALPFVTAGVAPRFAPTARIAALLVGDFDPRAFVYLPEEARASARATGPAKADVSDVEVGPNRVSFRVDAAGAAWAVVAQSDYPAWVARIDGEVAPILRANLAFQAVEVPPGRHRVELSYEDRAFRRGLFAAAAGLVALAALAVAGRRAARVTAPAT